MKPIDRLRQEYKKAKNNLNRTLIPMQSYNAMRLFCLDCNLVSFNDIEMMEFEVDNSSI